MFDGVILMLVVEDKQSGFEMISHQNECSLIFIVFERVNTKIIVRCIDISN